MGWTCRLEQGGDEQRALERLRAAAQEGQVLIGPLDMGYLTYNPNYRFSSGADHFLVVLAVESTTCWFTIRKDFLSSHWLGPVSRCAA